MNIYIISVEDEKSSRWLGFTQQAFIKHLAQDFIKVGVRGADLPTKQYFELGVKGRSTALTPGEVGCTLSHLKALEYFLASEEEYALILEDDAIIADDLNLETLSKALKDMQPAKNFLFSLGGIQMKECLKVRGNILNQLFLNKPVLQVAPDFYHRVCCTVAYIVDRDMAETLIQYHAKLRRADDWSYLFDFDHSAHIYMAHIIDHPIIAAGTSNLSLSLIEAERDTQAALKSSRYGSSLRKNIAKLFYKKYTG